MQEDVPSQLDLVLLHNPFTMQEGKKDIIGHVSGRSTDIRQIIAGEQNAIVLAGARHIGKTTLIHFLQNEQHKGWTWRNEIPGGYNHQRLDSIHFIQVDLTSLENIEDKDELRNSFISLCAAALHRIYKHEEPSSDHISLKKFVELLREISQYTPDARYFLVLDAIERLGRNGLSSFAQPSKAQEFQEYGLALLDHSNAIRTIVDLMGEFRVLGFLFSIESLPRSRVADQFRHISADLARFATMTLQIFTQKDAEKFLAQEVDNFDGQFAEAFKRLKLVNIFSTQEQQWLLRQAGTHPYLLQRLCFYAFQLKQEQMKVTGRWIELDSIGQQQVLDSINESLSTFFSTTWNRLQEAMQTDPQTRAKTITNFQEFIEVIEYPSKDFVIPLELWSSWGSEIRYILSSEGILRYDRLQPVYIPGELLRCYLMQKAHEIETPVSYPSSKFLPRKGYSLNILRGVRKERVILSELEYHLFKELLQHPEHCTDTQLMLAAWGRTVGKQTLTQRMYHLHTKLRNCCGREIIDSRYGGLYILKHREWFQLE